ncbi:MAG: tetratricopeptide repeat protein [Candidatus Coatesbacteria bacterium]|nr:MAG: tetratricopeptide repeat protein [Candidatus Coatesbacteria bacterium]
MVVLSPSDEERIKRYEEILAKEPGAIIFAVLGSLYARKYEFDKAIEVLAKGAGNFPNYFSARILLSKCYLAKGDAEAAVDEITGVLGLDPYNVAALNLLGDVFRDGRLYDEAGEHYRKILEIEPENTDVQYKLHLLEQLAETEPEPAVEPESEREPAETRDKEEGLATITLAEVYAEQGLLDKAASIINRLLKDNPDDAAALEAYERIRRLIDAETELTGESVLTIVNQVASVKGLMEEDDLDVWHEAQREVARTVDAAGVSFPALLRIGSSYSTAGETLLTVDGVAGSAGVFSFDTLEIDPVLAELLMVEFELGGTPAASRTAGIDEIVFDAADTEAGPADDAVAGEPADNVIDIIYLEDEAGTDVETEVPPSESATPPSESVVKPEMYIPREVKQLDEDPFGEDSEFLGWLNSIRLRDL